MYDVVVAGGSIAGLLCAREIAHDGFSVLVLEEDSEIGTPEHCSGLVSSTGLGELGIIPSQKTFEHVVKSAEIFAPGGRRITLDAKNQRVLEVSRRELDKQAAFQAQKNGAVLRVKTPVQEFKNDGVRTKGETIGCRIIVDARGVSSLIQKDRDGILASAQYEVYADWISKGKIQLFFDQEKYPGFFAWVVPSGESRGKVGVAGRQINPASRLEEFLEQRGDCSIIRKIFAPIWVKGPIGAFVEGNVVTVGDAAGQTKPTTAGGIYTAGMGGILAGRSISEYLKTNDPKRLGGYQKQWNERFGREFEKQLLARRILERLCNDTLDKIFDAVTPEMLAEISERDDFDFHTSSIVRLLGLRGSLKTAQALIGGEIKKLLR